MITFKPQEGGGFSAFDGDKRVASVYKNGRDRAYIQWASDWSYTTPEGDGSMASAKAFVAARFSGSCK